MSSFATKKAGSTFMRESVVWQETSLLDGIPWLRLVFCHSLTPR